MEEPRGNFPKEYFRDEVRDGYLVTEKMKRIWAAQIEVLLEIRRICEKHRIPFFADWGSLLGAVRHGGFIPWDDDLDIGMLREDYRRFLHVAPEELEPGFECKSLYNDPTHDNVKARVITGRHMNFDPDYLRRFHYCPYIVGIDIFPIDTIPADRDVSKKQCMLISKLLTTASSIPEEPPYSEDVMGLMKSWESILGKVFDYKNNWVHELKKALDMVSGMYGAEDGDEVCSMIDLATGWDYHAKRQWYQESVEMPFETTTIPVPVGYDGLLKIKYGEDYMTPQIRECHGFVEEQEQTLKTLLEADFHTKLSDQQFGMLLQMKTFESVGI
jgi:lipopolysaccharide cholinephosphotransferase